MSEPKRSAPPNANEPLTMPRRGSPGKWILGAAILLLAALVATFGLREFGIIRFPWDPAPSISSNVGGSIKQGTPGMTHEELAAAIQAEADKAYIRIKINARPVFESGDAEGNLFITVVN